MTRSRARLAGTPAGSALQCKESSSTAKPAQRSALADVTNEVPAEAQQVQIEKLKPTAQVAVSEAAASEGFSFDTPVAKGAVDTETPDLTPQEPPSGEHTTVAQLLAGLGLRERMDVTPPRTGQTPAPHALGLFPAGSPAGDRWVPKPATPLSGTEAPWPAIVAGAGAGRRVQSKVEAVATFDPRSLRQLKKEVRAKAGAAATFAAPPQQSTSGKAGGQGTSDEACDAMVALEASSGVSSEYTGAAGAEEAAASEEVSSELCGALGALALERTSREPLRGLPLATGRAYHRTARAAWCRAAGLRHTALHT
ncbi:hypothetical protein WJX81_001067 [Elliptochloris bilobata]|uniref:Uncharacterized protein n=1 Tax=Elliptochloris bilobata TaxID=381761 RepID=A0AAW1QTG5_9CHLO